MRVNSGHAASEEGILTSHNMPVPSEIYALLNALDNSH
jgi:hypothetical protein